VAPLATYYKFLSGALDSQGRLVDVDYADASFSKNMALVNPQGVQWMTQGDVVFCPLWTFKGQ
jgi:hypothetical protein